MACRTTRRGVGWTCLPPQEPLRIGAPGEGFKIAMRTLDTFDA